MRQAHHHEVSQVTTPHVVAFIDPLYDPVIVFEKRSLFAKLDFKGALCHFQRECDARGGIPVPIDGRAPGEVK
ncbi:hypothetical protein D3C81_2048550 [compost metagenome]